MKIQNLQGAMQAYNKNRVSPKQEVKNKQMETDAMTVSAEAKTFSAALAAVKNSPDIRQDKVDALKDKIDSGNYKISDEQLVDKLIESMQRKY